MYLLVGLGNPGSQYTNTRHNIGFEVIDSIFDDFANKKKLHADIAEKTIAHNKVIGMKPTTFMNLSGHAVALTAQYYKIPTENIIVIHDDMDFGFGTIKVQSNRGPAGHNGIASLIEHLGTKAFHRVRIGILPPDAQKSDIVMEKFVLQKFTAAESNEIPNITERAASEIESFFKNAM